MKYNKFMVFVFFILASFSCLHAESIIVSVFPEAGNCTVFYQIDLDADMRITEVRRMTYPEREILESISAEYHEDGTVHITDRVGLLIITDDISLSANGAVISSNCINTSTHKGESAHEQIFFHDNIIEDFINDNLYCLYNISNKSFEYSRTESDLSRKANVITCEDTWTMTIIGANKDHIRIQKQGIPQILPDDIYEVSANIMKLKKSNIILYYILIPDELRFLFLLRF